MSGILYVVATPIGNLDDISIRAVETLKNVSLIAAEDTRTTEVLLKKYEIKTSLTSYHKFNETEKTKTLIEKLLSNEDIALVSDAGTPLISDPGNILVKAAIKNNIKIVPIGGISAVTTFLSSISREGEDFKFIGFLPRVEKQIEKIFFENKFENLIFYESPQRIKETFNVILKTCPRSKISIGRELTKKFEEIKTGEIEEIIKYYELNPLKGEIVCMLHKEQADNKDDEIIKEKVSKLKKEGFSQKEAAAILNITDKTNKNLVKDYYGQID